jgi:hypothetical protein
MTHSPIEGSKITSNLDAQTNFHSGEFINESKDIKGFKCRPTSNYASFNIE